MVNKQYSATDLEAFMKIAATWQNSGQGLMEGVDIKSEMQQYINSPAMNMYKKRERTQNWNHQEKKYLLELCRKDMRIIENKRLDAGLTAVKNKAWKIIHQKFSKQFGTDRTCNRLKEQWRRMKACTRNEIIDYNNRVQRQGQEVADRKRPSQFTFEVWEFMQEAKRICKSEALDGIDYSKIPLALEEGYEYREDEQNPDEDRDLDDSRTPPQELCDIDIKEETLNETMNDTYNNNAYNNNNDSSIANGIGERLSSSSSPHPNRNSVNDIERIRIQSPHSLHQTALMEHTGSAFLTHNGSGDLGAFQPAFHMSNISATLEALNALRNAQFPSAAAAAAAALTNNFAAAAVQQAQHKAHQQAAVAVAAAAAAHQQQQQQQQQQQENLYDEHEESPNAKRARTSSSGDEEHHHNHQQQQKQHQQQQQQQQQSQENQTNEQQHQQQQQQQQQQQNEQPHEHEHSELNEDDCNSVALALNGHRVDSSSINLMNKINNSNNNNNNNVNSTATSSAVTPELRCFMDMQTKEHMMRMSILEVQLQAAKFNRDLIEINKIIAAQKLRLLGIKH